MEKPIPTDKRPDEKGRVGSLLAPILAWAAPALPVHERSKGWYIKGGVIALLLIAWGIISGSWTFSVVIVLCAGLYFLIRSHTPEAKPFIIAYQGVSFDGIFTQWDNLKNFRLLQTPTYTELTITQKARRSPTIHIQTGMVDPQLIRMALSQFLPEDSDHEEGLLDIIIRICKL